jgi:thioredoxin 1
MAAPAGTSRDMSHVLEVNDHNLEATLAAPVPVLIDFTAVWCPPCRAIAPHLEAIAAKYGDRVRVARCDTDGNPALSARFDVRSLPTLLMFKDGQVVGQIVGAVPRPRIEALVERAL